MLSKRDLENARLREQREQQSAELNERKQRDAVKFASIQEYKSLLESNSVNSISYAVYFAKLIFFSGPHTNITIRIKSL
jgi:hypothetical protein